MKKKTVAKYAPIKKVISGLLASLIVYLAHRYLSLDLGSAEVAEAVIPAVGFLVSYAVRDARVKKAADTLDELAEATS